MRQYDPICLDELVEGGGGVCRTGGGQLRARHMRGGLAVFSVELGRFRARAKHRIDGRLSQKPRDVVWDALGDGAVVCSLDGAFGQNIP